MPLTICPLSQFPAARDICIAWSDAEWGQAARFTRADWEGEFSRIEQHPIDEIFVAFKGDTPVGMVWLLEHEGVESHQNLTPWLSCLVVDPAHRDTGVGAALITHIEAYAATGGDKIIYLLTETPAVYFSRGWEVKDTASLDEKQVFVMQKGLNAPAVGGAD